MWNYCKFCQRQFETSVDCAKHEETCPQKIETCKWDECWIGRCKSKADESGFCSEHKNKICCSCGEPATHNCEETGQFVCGALLCDECEHTIFPEGHNGGIGFDEQPCPEGMKRHCKKSEQKFKPWFQQHNQ